MVNFKTPPHTADGKLQVSVWPTEGDRVTIVSHNWCDPTTWYQESQRLEEPLTANISGTEYAFSQVNLIDTCHGKLWAEDDLNDGYGSNYKVEAWVDEGGGYVVKAQNDPHTGEGDFAVDFAAGIVTFSPPISATATVSGNGFYATASTFTIAPSVGKNLLIKNVEVQFTTDIFVTDTMVFQAYGNVEDFAPHLTPSPFPAGTNLPLASTKYKTIMDFAAESNGSLPVLPVLSSGTWRGMSHEIVVFPWNYAAMMPLESAKGMRVDMFLEHDDALGGEMSTATFYCLSEDCGEECSEQP